MTCTFLNIINCDTPGLQMILEHCKGEDYDKPKNLICRQAMARFNEVQLGFFVYSRAFGKVLSLISFPVENNYMGISVKINLIKIVCSKLYL